MSLNAEQVKKVAHLARIALSDEEIKAHAHTLSNIFDLVEQMNAVNTDGIEPMSHPLDIVQPTRADTVTEPNQQKALQAIAPCVEAGLYLVPQVIEDTADTEHAH